jgi:hypothetical protein
MLAFSVAMGEVGWVSDSTIGLLSWLGLSSRGAPTSRFVRHTDLRKVYAEQSTLPGEIFGVKCTRYPSVWGMVLRPRLPRSSVSHISLDDLRPTPRASNHYIKR